MKLTLKEFKSLIRKIILEELDKNEEFSAETLVENTLLQIRDKYLALPSSPKMSEADWKLGMTKAEVASGDNNLKRTRISNRLKTYFKTSTTIGKTTYEAGEISWLLIVDEVEDKISVVLDHTPTNGQSFRVFKGVFLKESLRDIAGIIDQIMLTTKKVIK